MSDKELMESKINEVISYHSNCTAPSTHKGSPEYWNGKQWARKCPDYVNDLNAMHRVEEWLTDQMYDAYCNELVSICVRDGRGRMNSATARQRAEAFLKSFGAWREEAKWGWVLPNGCFVKEEEAK